MTRQVEDCPRLRRQRAVFHSGTAEPVLVGVTGFEPATSRSRSERATRLRYTPFLIPVHRITVLAIGIAGRFHDENRRA